MSPWGGRLEPGDTLGNDAWSRPVIRNGANRLIVCNVTRRLIFRQARRIEEGSQRGGPIRRADVKLRRYAEIQPDQHRLRHQTGIISVG